MFGFEVDDRVKKKRGVKGAGTWKKGTVMQVRDDDKFSIGVLADGETWDGWNLWWMEPSEIKQVLA